MRKRNTIFILAIIIFIAIIAILVINNILSPKEGQLIKITYEEITQKLDNKENLILVISQSTCSHCATYKPKLTTIAKDYNLDIYYIDYDLETETNHTNFFDKLNFNGGTPTTIFIKNGKETSLMDRLEGDLSSTKVIDKFKKMGFI